MNIEVNTEHLTECIESWVETFDDCSCCPLMFDCQEDEDIRGIDCIECSEKIIDWLKA